MNLKYIKFAILSLLLMVCATVSAQRNIFRSDNVTITSPSTITFGSIQNINDNNLNTDVELRKTSSNSAELFMDLVQAEAVKNYQVDYYYSSQNATQVTISGSQDKSNWTLLDKKTFSSATNLITSQFNNNVAFKYYRLFFENITRSTLDVRELSSLSSNILVPTLTISAGVTSNLATISWTRELTGTGTYELERSDPTGTFKLITTTNLNTVSFNETTLLRNTQYFYRVRTVKDGTPGAWSEIKGLLTGGDVLTSTPTLNATASTTNSALATLSWSLPIGGPGSFEIERSIDGTNFDLLRTFDKTVTSFVDSTLTHNTGYWYRVRGINDVSKSPYSVVRKITSINDALVNKPNITVNAISGSQVGLSWSGTGPKIEGFEIEKSTDGQVFTPIGKFAVGKSAYTEESLSLNTSYWYKVRAYNYIGYSPYSDVKQVTTNGLQSSPSDITNDGGKITVSHENSGGANAGEGSAKFIDNNFSTKWLVFSAQMPGTNNLSAIYEPKGSYVVTSYTLTTANDAPPRDPKSWTFAGSDDQSTWTTLDTRTNQLGAAVDRFVTMNFTIATPGTKAFKFYRIMFTANNGSTDIVKYQIGEWEIFGLDPTAPNIPNPLTISTKDASSITLNWNQDNANPVNKFVLQRSLDKIDFELIDTLAGTLRTYTDKNLYDATTYHYRIKAIGTAVTASSGFSAVASATTDATPGLPLTPTNLIVVSNEDYKIGLKWVDRSNDETGFVVERSKDNILFEALTTLKENSISYLDTTVWTGNKYYYRVAALKDKSTTNYTNIVEVTNEGVNAAPVATAPLIYQRICGSAGEFSLSFNASPGPLQERDQTLTVTRVSAATDQDEKYFSSFSFDPIVTKGTVNYKIVTSGVALPGDSAFVKVTVKDNGGTHLFAPDSTEFVVKVYFTDLTVKIVSDKGLIGTSRYAEINLTAQTNFPDNTTFQWDDAPGILGGRDGIKLLVSPIKETTYHVTATTPQGCSTSSSITIVPQDSFIVSSVLTPNGDGKNDTWIVWGIEKMANSVVKVTDRQGRLVFTKRNYQNDWDGTVNGSVLPKGGYYFIVEPNDGVNSPIKGVLTIVK